MPGGSRSFSIIEMPDICSGISFLLLSIVKRSTHA
uniref:Uncharacterized protein n=1 Tax=Siphoviridae sp. ctWWc42 TaxID=2826361 RepID=A0A8S5R197_9CAUD|nr:MAG TPA: hypothetical protein [Siphoviridae sp. ctWWc42]